MENDQQMTLKPKRKPFVASLHFVLKTAEQLTEDADYEYKGASILVKPQSDQIDHCADVFSKCSDEEIEEVLKKVEELRKQYESQLVASSTIGMMRLLLSNVMKVCAAIVRKKETYIPVCGNSDQVNRCIGTLDALRTVIKMSQQPRDAEV